MDVASKTRKPHVNLPKENTLHVRLWKPRRDFIKMKLETYNTTFNLYVGYLSNKIDIDAMIQFIIALSQTCMGILGSY